MLMILRFCLLHHVIFSGFCCPSSDWLEVSHASTGEGEDDVAGNQAEPGGKKGGQKPRRSTGTQFNCFASTKVQILTPEGLDLKETGGKEELLLKEAEGGGGGEKEGGQKICLKEDPPPSPKCDTPLRFSRRGRGAQMGILLDKLRLNKSISKA
jgi:hypothetical protein